MYLTFNFKEIQTMHISVRFCKSWKGFWQAHEGCNWITNSTHRIYIWHWNTHAQKMKKLRRNELYEKCCQCFGHILSFVSRLWRPHHKTLKTCSPPHRWGTWETAVSNNNNSSLFCIGVLINLTLQCTGFCEHFRTWHTSSNKFKALRPFWYIYQPY